MSVKFTTGNMATTSMGNMATISAPATLQAFYVVAITVLVMYVLRRMLNARHESKMNLPPGPPGLPIIGTMHLLGKLPHQNLAKMARKYGPVMFLRMGKRACIVASSPAAAMEFLKHQDATFVTQPLFRSSQVAAEDGIVFNSNTATRQKLRKILTLHLTGPKQIEASRHIREEEVAQMLHTFNLQHQEGREVMDVRNIVTMLNMNVVSRMLFNKRFCANEEGSTDSVLAESNLQEAADFKEILYELFECFGSFYPGDFIAGWPKWLDIQGMEGRLKRVRKRVQGFGDKIIMEHKKRRERLDYGKIEKDMVDLLLDWKEEKEGNDRVTESNVKGMMWDILGGAVSNSVPVEWTLIEMLRNPSIFKKANEELDTTIGPHRQVRETDLPNLPYIRAIVKESLRIHPPFAMTGAHQSSKAVKAFGYDVPPETMVFVNMWAMGRDEGIWEHPLEFRPERFMVGSPHASVNPQGQHFELLPFGSGRRMCPGQGIAVLLVEFTIASLLHAFEWHPCVGVDPKHMDLSEGVGIACPPASPLYACPKPRLPSHLYHPTKLVYSK